MCFAKGECCDGGFALGILFDGWNVRNCYHSTVDKTPISCQTQTMRGEKTENLRRKSGGVDGSYNNKSVKIRGVRLSAL